jgi:hypothetical protein
MLSETRSKEAPAKLMAGAAPEAKLSHLRVYALRMLVFLAIVCIICVFIYRQILEAFQANTFLNALIVLALVVGIVYTFQQVWQLSRELRWLNGFRAGEQDRRRGPVLLGPMARILTAQGRRDALSPSIMRSILESVALRLDESREISRYLIGLLVFLGLLGTFWGLLTTVSSVAETINTLGASGDAAVIFEDLKNGLQAPLSGMGTAFSSSLFGLAGSLILGFLDLQAGQAQSRFYTHLEDWLSGTLSIGAEPGTVVIERGHAPDLEAIQQSLRTLQQSIEAGSGNRGATAAMADLAEGIQGLVQHMRHEQRTIREWVEAQAEAQGEMKMLLQSLNTQQRPPRQERG